MARGKTFSMIAAATRDGGLGKDGKLPWRLPREMRYFETTTSTTKVEGTRNAVIMGRKTWESIPDKYAPLPGRLNVIVTRQADYQAPQGVRVAGSLESALAATDEADGIAHTFVIGGGQLYALAMVHALCGRVLLTRIDESFECDAFFPEIPPTFELIHQSEPQLEKGLTYVYETYARRP